MSAPRKIIHCDCDCFYAAVEMRDAPNLAYKAVAVGGSAECRGVVATCNYRAREFGIRSAMPMAQALRHCPELVVIHPDFEKYRRVSAQIRGIFNDYSELIEPLSLDEAYLDVSDSEDCRGSATLIAEEIRARVREEVGVTISAGVAPNKFLAKIASDWRKPDGLFVITPEQVEAFVRDLPVGKLFGVGRVTEQKLHAMGARTCADLRGFSEDALVERFGRFGKRLARLCRGIDERVVSSERRRKSLSVERTYPRDLPGLEACRAQLPELLALLSERYRKLQDDYAVTGHYLKMRFNDFSITSVECRGGDNFSLSVFHKLCDQAWARKERPVRLLGLGLRFATAEVVSPEPDEKIQLSLFESI